MKLIVNLLSCFSLPPLTAILFLFILGIIFSYWVSFNFILLLLTTLLTFVFAFISSERKFLADFFLIAAIFFLGAVSYQNSKIVPKHNISNFIRRGQNALWLKAKLYSAIDTSYTSRYRKRSTFVLKVLAIEDKGTWVTASGKLKATLFFAEPDFSFGDILLLKGVILEPREIFPQDTFDYKEYLSKRGIYGLFQIRSGTVKVIYRSRNFLKYMFLLKDRLRSIIEKTLPYPQSAVLSALLLGERAKIPKTVKESFIRTGTLHILAISGLHVGLISYIFHLFLKILRIPRKTSYFVLIFLLVAYAVLTGGKTPVVRATIMAVVYLAGLLLWRRHHILNSLVLAALVILIFRPRQLFDAGFQLSFTSVLAIFALVPRIEIFFRDKYSIRELLPHSLLRGSAFYDGAKRYVIRIIVVSFSAWLGVLPIVGHYFKIITPIAVLANIIVIPLVFLILAIGALTLLCGIFALGIANIFSNTNFLCISLLMQVNNLLSKIPYAALKTEVFSGPVVFSYYFFLLVLYLAMTIKDSRIAGYKSQEAA